MEKETRKSELSRKACPLGLELDVTVEEPKTYTTMGGQYLPVEFTQRGNDLLAFRGGIISAEASQARSPIRAELLYRRR